MRPLNCHAARRAQPWSPPDRPSGSAVRIDGGKVVNPPHRGLGQLFPLSPILTTVRWGGSLQVFGFSGFCISMIAGASPAMWSSVVKLWEGRGQSFSCPSPFHSLSTRSLRSKDVHMEGRVSAVLHFWQKMALPPVITWGERVETIPETCI